MMKFFAKYSKYFFFVLGFIVFAELIRDYGINNILFNLSKAGWWILLIIGTWIPVYLLNTFSLMVILGKSKSKVGFRNSLLITVSGFAINYVTPFASVGGEPFRMYKLKNFIGAPAAVSKVILCKMVQLSSHFILWLITIIIMLIIFPSSLEYRLILVGLFILITGFGLLFMRGHKKGIIGFFYSITQRLRIKPLLVFLRRQEDRIAEADENIRELYTQRRGAFYLSLSIEFMARIVSSFEFYFILLSIGLPVSVLEAIYINSISSLFLNLFFFVPLELGVRESSLLLIMKTINITAGIGVFIAVMNRIREFFWILTGLLLIKFITSTSSDLKPGMNSQ